jgi:hypothetical protein
VSIAEIRALPIVDADMLASVVPEVDPEAGAGAGVFLLQVLGPVVVLIVKCSLLKMCQDNSETSRSHNLKD